MSLWDPQGVCQGGTRDGEPTACVGHVHCMRRDPVQSGVRWALQGVCAESALRYPGFAVSSPSLEGKDGTACFTHS